MFEAIKKPGTIYNPAPSIRSMQIENMLFFGTGKKKQINKKISNYSEVQSYRPSCSETHEGDKHIRLMMMNKINL
jgi:hypothetical protein